VLTASNEKVTVFGNDFGPGRLGRPHVGALYIPVHSTCMTLADHYIARSRSCMSNASTDPPAGSISSIDDLWEVLHHRLLGTFTSSTWKPLEPNDFYDKSYCRNVDWEAGDTPAYGVVSYHSSLIFTTPQPCSDEATAVRSKPGRDTEPYGYHSTKLDTAV